jgi:hypothetical protein
MEMFVGENMKNVHNQLVEIAVKSSQLLELVQWNQTIDQKVALKLIEELTGLLNEVKEEISLT